MTVRRVVVLGSTGSIGTQALDVATAAPDRFQVVAVAAGGADVASLAAQAIAHRVTAVGVSRPEAREELVALLERDWPVDTPRPQVVSGGETIVELATLDADVILNAVAGHQGLRATVAALDAGQAVALANKESLVAGGELVTSRAKEGQLVPVDSEHSAIAQCLRSGTRAEVRQLILTASGGPFRGRSRSELATVTPEQAAAHPTWSMGPLITTNSATLVNKGLELIEAHLLFDVPYSQISVVTHPQSIVHSMVEFVDGSTIAQASPPDMRLTIALALGWPDRVPGASRPIDWSQRQSWTFEPVDNEVFPAIELARLAGEASACAPAVFNAANEELVGAFHSGRIGFTDIVTLIELVLLRWLADEHTGSVPGTVEEIEAAQRWARRQAQTALSKKR
ncbi:1-deoxy-D-xylulose-5-phosphate reductoisomerase [Jatrophihabitans sp. GAS493]|uniref:1-deoxy-D-xylulose-5-phosphate reductoisomerase n=1 Tax=Jatrophihabitans sp. GAS493 TaxID=1907575 RepID=UPI000BB978D3|nr:1-deoxy-D-xylulose-5-phosphate reductoisomerase [Jatrophihabitans sp. GAS493]